MLVGIRQNGEISCQPLHQKCTLFEMVINTDIDKLLLADILLWGEGEGRDRGGGGGGEGWGRGTGGTGAGEGACWICQKRDSPEFKSSEAGISGNL